MSENEYYCFTLFKLRNKKDGFDFTSQHLSDVNVNHIYPSIEHNIADRLTIKSSKYRKKALFFETFPIPKFELLEEF